MTKSMPERRATAEDEARRWIARMASAEMTADELALFTAWRAADPTHNRAFEQQRAVWRAAGRRPAAGHGPARRRSRWPRFPSARRVSRPAAAGLAAAAIAALLLGPDIAVLVRADHRAGTAVESVMLPDGSRASLNAGAAIVVAYDDTERRIELLRGDAWFTVAHGDNRPFRVTALGGVTEDIGTAFEVRRDGASVAVAVTEGAVEVRAAATGARLPLRAAQRARYDKGGAVVRLGAADPTTIAAWRQNEILLDRATVAEAVAQIGRYRAAPVFVVGAPAPNRRISGVFRADRPDEAIDAVAGMADLAVYRLGGITMLRPRA
ncbi:FecR family protein [Sphingomonas flavalba]|uniref:FecR family protein n=1 Tax=Sphingomonas flavalba TaxID=2559804 RepID=UPI0039DF4792